MWSVFGSRWTVLCSEGFANISSCRQEMGLLAPYNSNVTSQAQPHSLQSPTCYWVDAAHFYAWDCSKHYFGHWSLFIGGLVAFVRSSANYPRAIRQVASFWLMVSEVLKMIGERAMWVGGAPHAAELWGSLISLQTRKQKKQAGTNAHIPFKGLPLVVHFC